MGKSVVLALDEFNRLAKELSERLEKVREGLDEACETIAKIRLAQADFSRELKRLEEKVNELERFKHRHFWTKSTWKNTKPLE